jgi:hypothetical protein
LNHPLTARRGTHDSRPVRWESWTPHPSAPRRGGEGAHRQAVELAPIALGGPRLGGSTLGYTSWTCPNASKHRYARMAPPRPAEISLRPAKMNASHAGSTLPKTLQECAHSSKASGARPVGALAHTHRTAQRPAGKRVPSGSTNLCRSLRIPLQRLRGYCRGQP